MMSLSSELLPSSELSLTGSFFPLFFLTGFFFSPSSLLSSRRSSSPDEASMKDFFLAGFFFVLVLLAAGFFFGLGVALLFSVGSWLLTPTASFILCWRSAS